MFLRVNDVFFRRPLRQTTSWEKQKNPVSPTPMIDHRALSCDADQSHQGIEEESIETVESGNWSSDYSNSDDEDANGTPVSVDLLFCFTIYMYIRVCVCCVLVIRTIIL